MPRAVQRLDPGRTAAFHRLNRTEYQNAIRDLLALDVNVASQLPADDIDEQGFDNVADVLSVSPALLERYLSVARKVARLAVGRSPLAPVERATRCRILLVQDDRMNEELPFGSRGGTSIHHYFPIDGEYEIRIRLHRNYVNYIRGLGTPQELDVRLDGVLLKRFAIGGKAPGRPAPASYAGNIFGDAEWENYALYADSDLTLRFQAKAGPRVVGVSFVRNLTAPEGVLQPRQTVFAVAINDMRDGNAAVEEVVVGGPHAALGRRRHAEPPPHLRLRAGAPVRGDAVRSTHPRRPRTSRVSTSGDGADVDTLLEFYNAGRGEGSFDAGIQAALERLLISPDFLFRIERDPAGIASGHRVRARRSRAGLAAVVLPVEQHSRRGTAAARRAQASFASRRCSSAQVRRMLADPRARALIDNFGGQWLYLRTLANVVPDPVAFPDFDENLRDAFRRETELFFESQIRDDRGVWELLNADYTFANERLARALRHSERLRQPFPARRARRAPGGDSRGHSRPRQPADRDVVSEPHVAGAPRQVGADQYSRHAAATAAGRCAGPARARRGRPAGHGPRADGAASAKSAVPRLSRADGSARSRARELRCHRPVALGRGRTAD